MKQALHGLRILNTRPQQQATMLSQNIHAAGGIAIELPALEIQATNNNWPELLPPLPTISHALFISANAVHYCFTQLRQQQLTWPCTIKVIAIGQGTAAALAQWKIKVDAIPEFPDSEHLLSLTALQHLKQQNVLLFKGKEGRALIEEQLEKKGANLIILEVYQRVMPQLSPLFIE